MNLLVFPHQLFADHPGLARRPSRVVLIEDSLFFGDDRYPARFHQQKLWLHRASMKRYQQDLNQRRIETAYCDYDASPNSLKKHLKSVVSSMTSQPARLLVCDPADFILEKRLQRIADDLKVEIEFLESSMWINDVEQNQQYRASKKRWFMADFYKHQRRRLDILMEPDGEPSGGRWSFDEENRKKVPKTLLNEIPELVTPRHDSIDAAAREYVLERFADNPGNLDTLIYPTSHTQASQWLDGFLETRFERFGPYEDAIVEGESWLWHSVLTPMLNIGLLTPTEIIQRTLKFAEEHETPIASVEGFVRQIIGWREFIRATYVDIGVPMRTTNHWNHRRPLPDSFYDGSTGIVPVDDTIARILDTGYCHHIERLMVLGGFMFVCEIDPDDIYRWFMEMFIDSYDWVMVPNAYAMSQHADGGQITTKPYFSGSSYVRKMSHYKKGDWCDVWDGLYWRWIWNHHEELAKNPRWAMMCSMAKKMDAAKRDTHLKNANSFLDSLSR